MTDQPPKPKKFVTLRLEMPIEDFKILYAILQQPIASSDDESVFEVATYVAGRCDVLIKKAAQ